MVTIKKKRILKSTLTLKEFKNNFIRVFVLLLKDLPNKEIKISGDTLYFGNMHFRHRIGRGYLNEIKDGEINFSMLNEEIIINYQFRLKKLLFCFIPALFLLFFIFTSPSRIELFILLFGLSIVWGVDVISVILKMKYIIEDSIQFTNEDYEKIEISAEQLNWINDKTRCPACGYKILEQTVICPDCGLTLN